jgi:hypothetical protein
MYVYYDCSMNSENAELLTLIHENVQRARMSERNRILFAIQNGKWRSKKQLLEILNGENRRPSTENR